MSYVMSYDIEAMSYCTDATVFWALYHNELMNSFEGENQHRYTAQVMSYDVTWCHMWHLRRRPMSHVMSYDFCSCRMRLLKSRMWHHVMSFRCHMTSHFQAILDIIPFGRHPNVTCDVIWCHFEITWHDIPGVMALRWLAVCPPPLWSEAALACLCFV